MFLDSALIIWCFSRKIEESLRRAFPLWQGPALSNLSVIADAMPPLLVGEALAFRSASSSIGNFSAPPLAAVVAVASGLTDGSRAVSTKKEDPLSELQLREGVFFLVSQMTSSISTFTIYSICHSPQKSSFAQKVYKRPLSHLR